MNSHLIFQLGLVVFETAISSVGPIDLSGHVTAPFHEI